MTTFHPGTGHRTQVGQQLRRLAAALEHATGHPIEVVHDGPRDLHGHGGWRVAWLAGPSCAQMRELASIHASHAPDVNLDAVNWQRDPTAPSA